MSKFVDRTLPFKTRLESHTVSALRKEISKTNIKGYSKMNKAEVVSLMLSHGDRFTYIKHSDPTADMRQDIKYFQRMVDTSGKDITVDPVFAKRKLKEAQEKLNIMLKIMKVKKNKVPTPVPVGKAKLRLQKSGLLK